MKNYCVGIRIEGRYYTTVSANSIEEAKEKATNDYYDADFGELEVVDMNLVNVEDDKGDIVWEC